jgi:phosphoribosylaminoimidazole synthetase
MIYEDWIKWIKDRNAAIGEFSSVAHFTDGPSIAVSADGVGTKLLIAKRLNKFDTIGIDLVAMNVNDLIADGFMPFGFSNYIACGSLEEYLKDIIIGIEEGCRLARCNLMGGETAVMADMYGKYDFDLGGFAIGFNNDKTEYPRKDQMKEGDILLGIPSSGLHSNGFTLARRLLPSSFNEEMLTPTKIYTEVCGMKHLTLGAAHITGGGFTNIDRALPDHLTAYVDYNSWETPQIFKEIFNRHSAIAGEEFSIKLMKKEFNLGIGMVLIARKDYKNLFSDYGYLEIGKVIEK